MSNKLVSLNLIDRSAEKSLFEKFQTNKNTLGPKKRNDKYLNVPTKESAKPSLLMSKVRSMPRYPRYQPKHGVSFKVKNKDNSKKQKIYLDFVSKLKEKIDPEKLQKNLNKKNSILKMFEQYKKELKDAEMMNKALKISQEMKASYYKEEKIDPLTKIMNSEDGETVKYVSKFSKRSFFQKYKNLIADNSDKVIPDTFLKSKNSSPRKPQRRRGIYSSCAFGRSFKEDRAITQTPRARLNTSIQKERRGLESRSNSICKTSRKMKEPLPALKDSPRRSILNTQCTSTDYRFGLSSHQKERSNYYSVHQSSSKPSRNENRGPYAIGKEDQDQKQQFQTEMSRNYEDNFFETGISPLAQKKLSNPEPSSEFKLAPKKASPIKARRLEFR